MALPQSSLFAQFQRQFKGPLDSTELWPDFASAEIYAASYPLAYPGQTIKWLDEGGNYVSGIIQGNGSITPVGAGEGGGDVSSVNSVTPVSGNVTIDAKNIKMDKTDSLSPTVHTFTFNMFEIVGESENYIPLSLKLEGEGFLV